MTESTATAEGPIRIAVVGHTNAGKTSLLRTLTRRVDFGAVSDRPGTTRHAEAIELKVRGRAAVRFIDTPGLEDSVALLDYLNALPDCDTRPERVRRFLAGPEARGVFEQEAKVLRALSTEAEAAMYVIDSREPVLPKHRAELEILTFCARPVMPVLNFVADLSSRQAEWHQALLDANLHVQVEFDAVAPFNGAEAQLYGDLATLLRPRRAPLQAIVAYLAEEAAARRRAACTAMANCLVDLAAMRRTLDADAFADPAQQAAFVREFQAAVVQRARRAVDDLLGVFAFRADDAELATLPGLSGRWEDDLFNPELLLHAGKRLGMGAAVGAGIGLVADLALAGLSLGAATTLGATLGGAASGGWRPLWRKLENRFNGVQELTLEDSVLLLLTEHLLRLTQALERRGHAALNKVIYTADAALPADPASADAGLGGDTQAGLVERLFPVLHALGPARGHPDWEGERHGWRGGDGDRDDCAQDVARQLAAQLPPAGVA